MLFGLKLVIFLTFFFWSYFDIISCITFYLSRVVLTQIIITPKKFDLGGLPI